ncbi:hypothetical protein Q5M85_01865 [Paraclostridium bifermentans]|nr:hypothetical protein [Paraclostridium bifermentans]
MVSALFLTGCQASNTGQAKEEEKEKVSVVSATVSGTQVLDKLDAEVIGVPTTKMELPQNIKIYHK